MEPRGVRLLNPYRHYEGYNCFGCAPGNSLGLKMAFWSDGTTVFSRWQPTADYEGYHGVLHGGVQASLMDELASWVIFVVIGTSGFTKGMEVEFLENVTVPGAEIDVEGRVAERSAKRATLSVTLSQNGQIKSRAECHYAIFSEAVARRRLHYPGKEAFFPPAENAGG